MNDPTAFVTVSKIGPDRNSETLVTGYAWDTDTKTVKAYNQAKQRFEVPFEHADYLIDFFSEPDEMVDSFPIAELGYRALTKAA